MSIFRKAGTAAALSVAGVGIAVGGVGLAGAEDGTTTQDSSASAAATAGERPSDGRGHGRGGEGRGGEGRGGGGDLAAGLAEALDLEETVVADAFSAVREQQRSDDGEADGERTRPTEAEHAERQAELVAALADELGVSAQEVTAAFESLTEERQAAGRAALAERLDVAVADGDLTEADQASVLKAFDAGVLGGERHRR